MTQELLLQLGGALHETQDAYVCVNLDWWPANKCNWGRCPWANASVLTADLRHPRLRNALAALAPLHLRVGGTLQDSISYAMRDDEPCPPFSPAPPTQSESFTGGCLRRAAWGVRPLVVWRPSLDPNATQRPRREAYPNSNSYRRRAGGRAGV